jgi:hypothetical protein
MMITITIAVDGSIAVRNVGQRNAVVVVAVAVNHYIPNSNRQESLGPVVCHDVCRPHLSVWYSTLLL